MRVYKKLFDKIVSAENLFLAWDEFKRGKGRKTDVATFELKLEQNIFNLRRDLLGRNYRHGSYSGFYIRDPKLRHIHKASVRDRVLHHGMFRVLSPVFDPTFIPTSFSCRLGKGNHKGTRALAEMLRAESRNNTRACWALKCDVRKYFDSVDHDILLEILGRRIKDKDAMWLLREIVGSYPSANAGGGSKGIPIGNLTSQLFANVYLNELDQFVKHVLKVKHYARYTDDFVIVSHNKSHLEKILPRLKSFLAEKLALVLHPDKVSIRKYRQGADFLGYVVLPHNIAVRTRTKKRMFRKMAERATAYHNGAINKAAFDGALSSYLGVLSHADAHELTERFRNQFWVDIGG